jgi:hypothetical protein
MSVSLRRHTAKQIFEIIAPMEEQCGLPRAKQRYRKSGPWLISEPYLNKMLLRPDRFHFMIPGLKLAVTPSGRSVLLWRRFVGSRATHSCAADAIRVKSNLRAFYVHTPRPMAAKLVLDETAKRADGLRNEIAVRSRLQTLGSLHVPLILSQNTNGHSPWYTEELIYGRISDDEDADLIARRLLPALAETYRRFGITWSPAPTAGRKDLVPCIESATHRVPWAQGWLPRREFMRRLRALHGDTAPVPHSISHGDLSPSNLLITPEEEVYVIDWETAATRPIMHDLCTLGLGFPQLDGVLEKLLGDLSADKAMPPRQQHLLALLARIVFLERQVQTGARRAKRAIRAEFHRHFAEANYLLNRKLTTS